MIKGLGHIAVRTRNLEESLRFYKEILGLPEAFRMNGDDGNPFLVYLYVAPGQFIELFPNGTKDCEKGKDVIGLVHICLEVDDIEAAYKLMQEKGAPIDSDIIKGKAKCLQFWIHDPDGNAIELMELPPESLQSQAIKNIVQNEKNEQ